ncbi:callose synthase 3-like [Dorcoceras hygrometricum]|uniref:Callose synthase 3-like n=1 Tax=Dorcoceras hygrometricum TaxID=472368 RepID=A0A2Z7ASQ0_9LAMI|nr:callose synthase 3-like [Dorcoceras hygrometricum]
MLEWAETDSLETAVKRRLFILTKYRELLLRTLLDSHRHYLVSGQPWTATASQTFDLLSAVHSESLDALRNHQQEHGIFLEQPCSSTAVDYAEACGAVLARFFSVAKSTCWVRPMICVDGIWTPLQGPDLWRSGCKLSLFLNKVEMSAPAVQDIFGHSVSSIEPTQYWEAAPFLPKTWTWHCVCTEVFPFTISGRLRPASCSTDIVMYSLDVQKLPAYLLDDFQRGIHTDCFAGYFDSSVALSDSETHSDSSSGCTVYRSPSPVENLFALGPAIFSRVDQVEQSYFVQSPISPPAASSLQESSSSSDVSIHFDSEDLPMRTSEAAHTSAPGDSHASSAALEDLRSYFSKRIDESTTELRSKVNEVEFNVRGDLAKQQAWLRQMFHSACDILERQSTQLKDLKKGLLAPVSTIFQDLLDLKRNDRAHEAKLNALDGQVAALRNDQLEFQNRISADLLSLSTQFADIVEFIRGGDAKKGESGSSSRPPPVRVERRNLPIPPSPRDAAGSSGAVRIPTLPRTTGTFEERVEQARRHLFESGLIISVEDAAERIRQADIQESDRLQRERERARREKRSSSSRRRRGF